MAGGTIEQHDTDCLLAELGLDPKKAAILAVIDYVQMMPNLTLDHAKKVMAEFHAAFPKATEAMQSLTKSLSVCSCIPKGSDPNDWPAFIHAKGCAVMKIKT